MAVRESSWPSGRSKVPVWLLVLQKDRGFSLSLLVKRKLPLTKRSASLRRALLEDLWLWNNGSILVCEKLWLRGGQVEISWMICPLSIAIDFSLLAGEVYLALPVLSCKGIWDDLCGSQELKIKPVGAIEVTGKKDFSEGLTQVPLNLYVLWTNCPCLNISLSKEAWTARDHGVGVRLVNICKCCVGVAET